MQLPQFQAHADLEENHWWFLGRRKIVETLVHELLPPATGKKIVDVGCGTGGMTAFFSREYDCTGVDPTEEGISFAKQKYPHAHFIRGKAPDDVRDVIGQADLLLLLDVLEHVEQDIDFVKSLILAMKPGAYFLTVAPADQKLWGPHDEGFEHFRRYDPERLRETWKGMPVQELLLSPCNARLYPLARAVRLAGRLRGKAFGPANTDLSLPPSPLNAIMRNIYSGEAHHLLAMLKGERQRKYRRGVSLVAILKKQ